MGVSQTLQQAAREGRLAHALLFTSLDGVGLRAAALKIAQTLVCDTHGPCGTCGPCLRIKAQQSESLLLVQPENGVIKIDQVRPVREALSLENWSGARVVILDQAESLNPQAANALLKVIEEPPPATYFFLTTRQPSALLSTIRSRCQLVRLLNANEAEPFVAEFSDQAEFVKQSMGWWQDIAQGQKVQDDAWREVVREREGALQCVRLWSALLHQARRQAAGLPLTWTESRTVASSLSTSTPALEFAWTALLDLKSEIEAQVDRLLAVESFWLKVSAQYAGPAR
ncbi:MAG: hypothetical protein AB7N80_00640 [Bdellovibrionales bacterium]